MKLIPWPVQSPDMNVIEHVWDYLDRRKTEWQRRDADQCFKIWEYVF